MLDAVGGAGAQDPAAEDGGFQFQIGGLDLPPLVIQLDQFTGRVAVRIEQGGDQPVVAGAGAFGGSDGDLRVDDPDPGGADR